MRILLSIEHPAWAYQFRYVIRELEARDHTIKVVAINKDRSLELLDAFKIKYDVISNTSGKGVIDKGILFLKTTLKIFQISRKFKPDIFIGRPSPMVAINSFLFRKKHVVFEDTENSVFCQIFARLFSDVILTPNCFKTNLGRKQRRINAYKELFYLHPDRFTPTPGVLSEMGLSPIDKFVILRFVAWDAHHDIGRKGITVEGKHRMVKEIGKYARVLISSESPLPPVFDKYLITLPPENFHDLLYYATMIVSEGATVTTEAAVLGIPVVRVSPFVGSDDMGNFLELEERYGLLYNFREVEPGIQKAIELLSRDDAKAEWQKKREKMLAEKIDPTQLMIDIIVNYAEDSYGLKEQIKGQ